MPTETAIGTIITLDKVPPGSFIRYADEKDRREWMVVEASLNIEQSAKDKGVVVVQLGNTDDRRFAAIVIFRKDTKVLVKAKLNTDGNFERIEGTLLPREETKE